MTPDKGDAQHLWNLAPLMPAGRNYSRINQERPELIGHSLMSELLVKKADMTSVGAVLGTAFVDHLEPHAPNWTNRVLIMPGRGDLPRVDAATRARPTTGGDGDAVR